MKLVTISLLSILILVSSFIVYHKIPNNYATYDAGIKKFENMESMALEVFSMPANTPKDKLLSEIKDRGLYYWNEGKQLLDSLDKLDLPIQFKKRDKILKEYCDLRIESYELLYKEIAEDTKEYEPQLEDYNSKIKDKINELGGL